VSGLLSLLLLRERERERERDVIEVVSGQDHWIGTTQCMLPVCAVLEHLHSV
jgi:hypothetical protein